MKRFQTLLLLGVFALGASALGTSKSFAAPGEKYPQTKTRLLSAAQVARLSAGERRYAINEIYARHGLLFGDMAIRKQFLKFSWYRPQPGQSMAQIKAKFSRLERQNVERLSLAREIENASVKADEYSSDEDGAPDGYASPYANTDRAWSGEHFPETRLEKLDPDAVTTMTGAQKRYAINEIYARHGFLFGNMALRKQFLGFSWYKPRPKATMRQIAATLSPIERSNLAILTAAS